MKGQVLNIYLLVTITLAPIGGWQEILKFINQVLSVVKLTLLHYLLFQDQEIDDKHLTDQTKPLAQNFGDVLYDFSQNCWVNSVTWNKSGSLGIAANQDATIAVIDYKEKKNDLIKCKHSPVTLLIPNGDNSFFAVCYDRNIIEYEKKGDKWEIKRTVTTGQEKSRLVET